MEMGRLSVSLTGSPCFQTCSDGLSVKSPPRRQHRHREREPVIAAGRTLLEQMATHHLKPSVHSSRLWGLQGAGGDGDYRPKPAPCVPGA